MAKIPQAIPAVEQVKDPVTRGILIAMRTCINALFGLGNADQQALLVGNAKELGMLGEDGAGRLFAKPIPEKLAMTDQQSDPGFSIAENGLYAACTWVADGLTAGAHDVGIELPEKAVVVRSWYDVTTAFSGAGTISLGIPSDDVAGIRAAAALGAGWTAGNHDGIQDGATANFSNKTTAARQIQAILTNTITTGTANIFVEYVISR